MSLDKPILPGAITTLREAKERVSIAREIRAEKIRAAEDWMGLFVSKTVGVGMTTVGCAMAMGFSVGHLHLDHPANVFGAGLMFLVGSKPLRALLRLAALAAKGNLL
jgi:hypothetical protein